MEFLDFQFMRIVFLAIVRATRRSLLFVLSKLNVDQSLVGRMTEIVGCSSLRSGIVTL